MMCFQDFLFEMEMWLKDQADQHPLKRAKDIITQLESTVALDDSISIVSKAKSRSNTSQDTLVIQVEPQDPLCPLLHPLHA